MPGPWLLAVALLGSVGPTGQTQTAPPAPDVEQLRRDLLRLEEEFAKEQARQRRQLDELRRQIEALEAGPKPASPTAPPTPPTPAPQASIPPPAPTPSASPGEPAKAWSPTDPIRVAGGGRNYANLSLDGLFAVGGSTADDLEALEPGGHDPHVNGFTLQNLEFTLDGAVDPYFKAQANLIFQIDSSGESAVEVEEAFLTTIALPANLQVKAGQFFTEFGRLNPTHPHTWSFVDQPLVNARFFGGDGLRNPGARLSWLMPTPFYSELFLAVQNSQGETAASFMNDHEEGWYFGRPAEVSGVDSAGDLLFAPRYALSFDPGANQTVLLGASAALGPNPSGSDTRTAIAGVDLFWKWKSPRHHGGFPFVAVQTEAMARRYEVGAYDGLADPTAPTPALPGETLEDYGLYAQVLYGFRRGWVAGFRFDYTAPNPSEYEALIGDDPERARRWRVAPNLTWYPSEFSKLRLQYNYDDREALGVDHSVWLQFEFLLGAHAAHKF